MNQIYREELMEIYKKPMNKGALSNPSVSAEETNPMCGDEIELQLQIQNGKITDAKFDGAACAVSIISSALLTEDVIGKTLEEARKLTKDALLDTVNLNLTTSRVKCATLVLDALHKAIKKYEEQNN